MDLYGQPAIRVAHVGTAVFGSRAGRGWLPPPDAPKVHPPSEMLSFLPVQRYNPEMRSGGVLMVLCLAIGAFAADITSNAPLLPCPPGDSSGCNPTKRELKEAKTAFLKGLKLQKEKHTDDAYEQFDTAARLEPRNLNYLTSLEFARQQSVYEHLQAGNAELQEGKQAQSLDDFRAALQLDPKNVFAQQRVQDALGDSVPKIAEPVRIVEQSVEIRLMPEAALSDFHYKGDSRGLLTQVANAYRIAVQMDDSVVSRPVRFDISSVDFDTAMSAAAAVTHTFWTAMGPKQILIAADTAKIIANTTAWRCGPFTFPEFPRPPISLMSAMSCEMFLRLN